MGSLCIIWKKEPFTNRHYSVECSLLRLCVHLGVVLSCPMNRVLYSNVWILSTLEHCGKCLVGAFLLEQPCFRVEVGHSMYLRFRILFWRSLGRGSMVLPMNMPVGIATCCGRVWVGGLTEHDTMGLVAGE